MKKHCFLFALFIFLSSLYMQAEGTAGKWSERYNFTAITMDAFYGLPPVEKESPVMTVMNSPPSIWETPVSSYEVTL